MANSVQPPSNCRYSSILASRLAPILFIIISFLIIANIRCDQVGSSNGSPGDPELAINQNTIEESAPSEGHKASPPKSLDPTASLAKLDPLGMLREIYLDQNSKVVSLLYPQGGAGGDSVQKFHPNGRYGRRSVNNFADSGSAHSELAKLVSNGLPEEHQSGSLRALLRALAASGRLANRNSKSYADGPSTGAESNRLAEMGATTNYQLELNKLLRCNYTGISDLYSCDTGN